jgi:OAR motif
LSSVVSTNHHQNSINCFNSSSSSVAASMSSSMLPTMGTSLAGAGTTTGVGGPCPYTNPTNPYTMYHHRTTTEPGTAMSSSIATLRLKAKQHSSGFSSPYSTQSSSISPVSRSNSGGLAACQYASVSDTTVWDNVLVGTLFQQTSSLNHLLNSEHDLNFDQRDEQKNQQQGSNGTATVTTNDDDDDDCTSRNDGTIITNDINE